MSQPQQAMDSFRSALEECDLHDLGFAGDPYTWRNNNHDSNKYIRERLDRAVASPSWCQRFPFYKVVHGDPRHSDHRALIVQVESEGRRKRQRGRKGLFRFEPKWLEEDQCGTVVDNAWGREINARGGSVMDALKGVAKDLTEWSTTCLGQLEKQISRQKKNWRHVEEVSFPLILFGVSRF